MTDEPERDEFNVVQFFENGYYEYERRNVSLPNAMQAFKHYSQSFGARLGFVRRVIITDGGDHTNMEWKFGEGLTYPTVEDGIDPKLIEHYRKQAEHDLANFKAARGRPRGTH